MHNDGSSKKRASNTNAQEGAQTFEKRARPRLYGRGCYINEQTGTRMLDVSNNNSLIIQLMLEDRPIMTMMS